MVDRPAAREEAVTASWCTLSNNGLPSAASKALHEGRAAFVGSSTVSVMHVCFGSCVVFGKNLLKRNNRCDKIVADHL